MREVKFRAWDCKKMIENVIPFQHDFVLTRTHWKCIEANGNGILNSGGSEAKFEINGYAFKVLLEYTGFKYKNGKGICEGDAVRRISVQDELYKVFWFQKNACFALEGLETGKVRWLNNRGMHLKEFDLEPNDLKYYGNIHENPELLK